MEKEERNARMGEHKGIRNEVKIQTIRIHRGGNPPTDSEKFEDGLKDVLYSRHKEMRGLIRQPHPSDNSS